MPELKWSPPVQKQLVDELTRRGATKPCPRCDGDEFTILEGFGSFNLQPLARSAGAFGGPSVPVVLVLCTTCGFASPHALGILMPSDEHREERK